MLKTVAEHKTNNNKGGKIRRRKSPVSLTLLEAAENYKITDFYRRSTRKPESQKKKEENDILREAIRSGSNEKYLEIYSDEVKGRCIRSLIEFSKGDFVVEYKGDLIHDRKRAQQLENKYNKNPQEYGSYMYYFEHASRNFCVDATPETRFKGRLVNHSRINPNMQAKSVDFGGHPYLILVAIKSIMPGDELLYDYGEKNAIKIAANPWLVDS